MDWIVTDDISKEAWRRLMEYANNEIVVDRISQIHGKPTPKTLGNYKKQAAQARACVLQAQEYYSAARLASPYTSPNHIYYGNVCLATLTMLICGTGVMALDILRRDSKNSHHGLDFTVGCNANSAKTGICLLENSYCEILRHGHFANWYKCLPASFEVSAVIKHANGGIGRLGRTTVGGSAMRPYSEVIGRKFCLLNLAKDFPDLSADLARLGIKGDYTRADHYVESNVKTGDRTDTFLLHDLDTANKESVLSKFATESRGAESFEYLENPPGAIVRFRMNEKNGLFFSWPDSRETLNHDTIFYGHDLYWPEIVDLYLCSYQLSMLSRYFPDIWTSCIESQGKAAKLVELLIDVQLNKFPILALGILSGVETVISTHRAPWKRPVGG